MPDPSPSNADSLNFNFSQLGRRSIALRSADTTAYIYAAGPMPDPCVLLAEMILPS